MQRPPAGAARNSEHADTVDHLANSGDILTDDYLRQAEQRARRFSGAYTGTSGTLAADVLRILKHLRHVTGEPQMEAANGLQAAIDNAFEGLPEEFVKANGRYTLSPAEPQPPLDVQMQQVGASMTQEQLESAWAAVNRRREAVIESIQAGGVPSGEPVEVVPVVEAAAADKIVDGDRTRFATGAVRSSDAEATRYDLISPIGLEAVARTCAEGAAKYSAHNWERGMDVPDLLNHALRHIYQFLAGDRSEPHLPHAAWGLLAAIHSDTLWPHLNKDKLRGPGCTPPYEPPI